MAANEVPLSFLPPEAVEYLTLHRSFDYPSENCVCGTVTLLPPSELRIQNFRVTGPEYDSEPPWAGYMVRGIDLLSSVEGYFHQGVLAWLVDSAVFCSYDNEHENMHIFPGVSWAEICQNAAPFLSAQWSGDYDFFEPWKHRYVPSDDGNGWIGIADIEDEDHERSP